MADLRDLPAVRAEAERLARDFLGAADVAFRAAGWDTDLIHGGEDYAEDALRLFAAAHLDLLCDLTRPESRDAVARLVAAKLGWLFGALVNDLESGRAATLDVLFRDVGVIAPSAITDPAEALRLIATHVLRSDNV